LILTHQPEPVPSTNNVKSETSSDPEKYQYDEDLHVPALSATTEAKLMRKIDLRVVPCLCVLYLLAFLDRCVGFPSLQLYVSHDFMAKSKMLLSFGLP